MEVVTVVRIAGTLASLAEGAHFQQNCISYTGLLGSTDNPHQLYWT